MSGPPITEADLHAWVDGQLGVERSKEIEAYLAQHPDDGRDDTLLQVRNDLDPPRVGPIAVPVGVARDAIGLDDDVQSLDRRSLELVEVRVHEGLEVVVAVHPHGDRPARGPRRHWVGRV